MVRFIWLVRWLVLKIILAIFLNLIHFNLPLPNSMKVLILRENLNATRNCIAHVAFDRSVDERVFLAFRFVPLNVFK